MTTEMTASEAAAELTAVGCQARVWRGNGLVTVYYQADGIKGEIWCRSISNTVRDESTVWAAIASIVNSKQR